jgi:2,4-dienoyl-CoA reductase-like NADH-dependent reductase (Old Yellow Enzyme family)/thioredoxin reductase
MEESYPHLFSPGKIGNVKIKNKLVFLPHYTALGREFGQKQIDYYVERAKGGTGLIIMGSHAVSADGKMSANYEDASEEKIIPEYEKLVEGVHKYGTKIFGQLTHGGHTTIYQPPQLLYAPSQMSEPSCYHNTKEMEIEDIKKVVRDFAKSAKNMVAGGLEGIEIKASSHDGLLRSFIEPYFNKREDEYGGNFENRMRLPLEVVHAIREVIPKEMPLGIRMAMDTYTSWGYGTEEAKKIVEAFADTGEVTYFACDAGSFSSFYMEIPPMAIPLGFAEYLSAEIKNVTDLPVIAFGRINDPVQAERILADGNADFIGMARELICDPEFANKAQEGRDDDIRHCIACQDRCLYQVMQDLPIRCIQNPGVGREAEYGIGTLREAEKKRKVAVIGGGPAGLKAAEIAARRGHEVSIYEEKGEFGGQVNLAAKIPLRDEVKDVTRYIAMQVEQLGVEIHLNERMTVEKVKGLDTDVVIMATGSSPVEPDIGGCEQENVVNVWDVLLDREPIGDHVMIFDVTRRWPGLGTAEYLVNMGKRVDLVTPTMSVGEQLEPGNVALVLQRIMGRGVRLMPNTSLKRVEGKKVTVENVYSHIEEELEGIDTVVLSLGNRSNRELYDRLKGELGDSKELYFIGDAVAPRLIQQALLEAEKLGRLV